MTLTPSAIPMIRNLFAKLLKKEKYIFCLWDDKSYPTKK
jgi:hypothetical protein